MPTLTIPNTFSSGTVIASAQMNANFTAITTLLNTTGLDDDNLQNAGITRGTKLKTGTAHSIVINDGSGAMAELTPGTSGQILSTQGAGSAPIWVNSSINTLYERVVGSATDVTNGVATDSTIAAAITAASAGDSILILNSYTGTENITVSKQLNIAGQGKGSFINGTVTFDSSSDKSTFSNVRVAGKVTLDSGADQCFLGNIWSDQTTVSGAIVDNSTDSFLLAMFLSS